MNCQWRRVFAGVAVSLLCVAAPLCGMVVIGALLAMSGKPFAGEDRSRSRAMRSLFGVQSLQSFIHQIDQVQTVRRCSNSVVTIANVVRQLLVLGSALL